MNATIAYLALGAIVAGFVQGLSGFAFSLVATAIWAWTIEPRLAAACAIFGGLCGQVMAAVSLGRRFDVASVLPYIVGALFGIPLGVALLPLFDVRVFKAALGGILVVWCPLMLVARRLPRITGGGQVADGAAGFLGGVCGGIGGFTGVVPTLWCALRGMDKDSQRGIIQNFNLAALAFALAAHTAAGTVTRDMLPMFALVLAAMSVPVVLGTRMYIGMGDATFRSLVLALLTASGVALLWSALSLPR